MTETKGEVILKLYNDLQSELSQVIDTNIFPTIDFEEIDLVDILYYFELFFPGNKDDFTDEIINCLDVQQILVSPNKQNKVIKICNKYLIKIKKLIN